MKAGIARDFTRLDPAKKRLEGQVYPQHHILQHLAVDFTVLRHRLFDAGQLGFLVIVGDGDTTHAVGFAALTNGGIVDMTAQHESNLSLYVAASCVRRANEQGFCRQKRQTEQADAPEQQQALEIRETIAAVAIRPARWLWQEANLFVEADGFG